MPNSVARWFEYEVDGYLHIAARNWQGRLCDDAVHTVGRYNVGCYPGLVPYCQGCIRKVLEVTK